jgi:hypothetical protein
MCMYMSPTAPQVTHLHAFFIKYSAEPGVAQTSLGRHRDDSTFTLNLCLSSSPDTVYVQGAVVCSCVSVT